MILVRAEFQVDALDQARLVDELTALQRRMVEATGRLALLRLESGEAPGDARAAAYEQMRSEPYGERMPMGPAFSRRRGT